MEQSEMRRPDEPAQSATPEPVSHYAAEPAPAPASAMEQQPQPEPREPRPARQPRVETPQVDAREALANAGLQMVETTKAPAPMPEPEPERLGRPRRERPAAASEEMVQVETRNK
jgi:hypothetical protein